MSYIVKIFTPQELNHSSYVQTGLFELENDGFLRTNVKLSFAKRLGTIKVLDSVLKVTSQPHPKTSFYKLVDTKTGKKIRFATDLYDASFSFSKYALENCDYVFKRNFEKEKIKMLPQKYQDKLFPLGLTFKIKAETEKPFFKFLLGIIITNLKIDFKIDSYLFKRFYKSLKRQLQHWNNFSKSTSLNQYKVTNIKIENNILFQTRCFVNEDSEDVKGIHQQRYRLIKILREKFPANFIGGFVPSKVVSEKYSDAITNLATEPLAYLNEIKKAKIVIYTRGLVNSPAWKMAEYLSQGKVIVAEKLTTELPVPLQHGKELLFYEKEEEIVPLIEKVLNDDVLSAELSKNARVYYDENVHPKQNIKRIIEFMLSNK